MNKRGQAAMEFLMTYGWAIVVVLAAIGALAYFGVLSPSKLLPDRTVFAPPLTNVDNAVIFTGVTPGLGNTVTIAFKNNKGVDITLPLTATAINDNGMCGLVDITGTYTDSAGTQQPIVPSTDPTPSRIQNGGGFLLTFDCQNAAGPIGSKFKADFTFPFVNFETQQTLSQTGTVEGKYS